MSIKFENTEVMGWEAVIRGMRNPMNSWKKSDSGFGCEKGLCEPRTCDMPFESMCYSDDFVIGPNDMDLMMRLAKAGSEHAKYRRMIVVYVDITAPLYWWKEFKTYRAGRKFGDGEPDLFGIPSDYLEQDIEMNSCSTMHKIAAKEFTIDDFSCEHLLCGGVLDDVPNNDGKYVGFDGYSCLKYTIYKLNKARELYLQTKDKRFWWQMIQLLPSSYNQRRTIMLNYEVLANIYRQRKGHKLDEWQTFIEWIETLPYSEIITLKEE